MNYNNLKPDKEKSEREFLITRDEILSSYDGLTMLQRKESQALAFGVLSVKKLIPVEASLEPFTQVM